MINISFSRTTFSDRQFRSLFFSLKQIKMNQEELAASLEALTAQTEKSNAELVTKIADLEAAIISSGTTTPAVDAALLALKASVQKVDDIVPDAV